MVAYLEKSEGSEGFHEIIDFLFACHIHYALTASPTIYTSLIEQFWQIAALSTNEDGVRGITATIDRKVKNLSYSFPYTQTVQQHEESLQGIFWSITPLFDTMLVQHQGEEPSIQTTPEISPSKLTHSPSLSSHHTSVSAPSTSQPPITPTEEPDPMLHESPLYSVHSLGRDKGSMQQHELMDLVTKLTDRIGVLDKDLQQIKKTYSIALTRLILRVKKLEKNVKTGKAMRKDRIVISEDEVAAEDSSKQGRKISDIDTDPTISLISTANIAISTVDAAVTTASASISNVSPLRVSTAEDISGAETLVYIRRSASKAKASKLLFFFSTAEDISGAETLVYIRRSASKAKDKGKAIMQESEPPKKIKKRVQVQMSIDEELAKKVFEEEQAKFKAEQEQEKFDFETALELQKKLDEREEVAAKEAHDIDWSDPSVLRYHALQNRPFSVAEVRKNMCMYLKNQGGYKMSHFKGMSYEEIRPIFERVWDQIQSFVPMDSEKEKGSEKKTEGRLKRAGQDVVEEPAKRQKTTEASESVQEQPSEEPKADELSQEQLQQMMLIVPEEGMHIEALQIKYPIIDWEVHSEDTMKFWKIIRVGNHTEVYQVFEDMLKNFDREDLDKLWSLVKERFNSPGLTDDKEKELWVELKRLFEPDDTDTLWKLQRYMHDPLKWWLYDTCGVHHVSTGRGHDIFMLVEKDYPLTTALMTLMLCNKLRVDQYSEMADELLQKIFILANRSRQLVQELNTAQDITNSTNWVSTAKRKVSTARRKVSTASTELSTARED
ncbi:hypothetical protein Tco_0188640 [Tanacetum coccineum]